MKTTRDDIRNIAIIAHVDHGKTTLVDELLKQSGVFRDNQEVQDRVMDSNDIERERGITILSKNTAIQYKDIKINIIDTPGHADFGGEVERVLKMVNGVILVVDAFEGVMPQTKFVVMKALALKLPIIVCVNKIDRPEARPNEVIDEVLELFMDLDASEEQLDCPFVFASARDGYAMKDLNDERKDMTPLFETIVNYIPAPTGDPDANTQILISTIDYNEYVGRIGIGKVDNGKIKVNQEAVVVNHHDPDKLEKVRISKLYEFDGLNKVDVAEAGIGSIVAISGIADIHIGDTICSPEAPEAIPFQKISEPTISMNFIVNNSPLAGQEGKFVTSRHIRDRLLRELNTDVSLRNKEALEVIEELFMKKQVIPWVDPESSVHVEEKMRDLSFTAEHIFYLEVNQLYKTLRPYVEQYKINADFSSTDSLQNRITLIFVHSTPPIIETFLCFLFSQTAGADRGLYRPRVAESLSGPQHG